MAYTEEAERASGLLRLPCGGDSTRAVRATWGARAERVHGAWQPGTHSVW